MKPNYADLRLKIRSAYHKFEDFAKDMGISPSTLSQKLSGNSEWTRIEVANAATLLNLSNEEIIDIFFKS